MSHVLNALSWSIGKSMKYMYGFGRSIVYTLIVDKHHEPSLELHEPHKSDWLENRQ